MNPELEIGLTRQEILKILKESNLPFGTLALLMESLTREIQLIANNAFEQAYEATKKDIQKPAQETVK